MVFDLFSFEFLPATAIAAVAVAYHVGTRRLAARGRSWPWQRSLPFYLGILSLIIATQTWIAAQDTRLFSAHVVQHLLLAMAAPVLMALGAPITLLLQATNRSVQTRVLRILHSQVVRVLSFPGIGWVLFSVTLFALYFTDLYGLSLRNEIFHDFVHLHFFVSGYLFFAPVVAIDPYPWRLPHGLRLLYVGLTLPVHAFLALALMSNVRAIDEAWYVAATGWDAERVLFDQRIGAGIMWVSGDLIAIITVVVIFFQWWKTEERVAGREDKMVDLQTQQTQQGPSATARIET